MTTNKQDQEPSGGWTPGERRVEGPDPKTSNPNMGLWEVWAGSAHIASHLTWADATLLAAAPGLFMATDAVLREFGHREGDDDRLMDPQPQKLLNDLQRALAKALGKDPQ